MVAKKIATLLILSLLSLFLIRGDEWAKSPEEILSQAINLLKGNLKEILSPGMRLLRY
jgi:hypothetical protein